ncbi:MAG: ABC transporter permease [Deltaproteobacteria bacterium]|nr:ABC transporter permease [Deltaproteobacteria bacterium]MBW2123690.1 ABC transporter permease [Deltaproteobacteria bacterium]
MVAQPGDILLEEAQLDAGAGPWARFWDFARRNPTVVGGGMVLILMVGLTLASPYISSDPLALNPIDRLRPPSGEHWFGTDNLGRDIYSRTLHGGRISLTVGISVAILASVVGLLVGLISGYSRTLDSIIMRLMDGLMAIPDILLAVTLVAITSASIENVVMAIAIPQVPRVARLVRSIVLTIREQPYVEAAVSIGTRVPKMLFRHILPNTMAALLVQVTYAFAEAVIMEALLGFIGAGTPPEIPSWGNIMAGGRVYFQLAPWIIFFPGTFLTLTVLAVNVMGDGLRDMLDPRLARQM